MEILDTLLAEMTRVHAELADLPDDAFAERYPLLLRRDAIRDELAGHHEDFDRSRSTADLLAELGALRTQMAAIEADKIDVVKQHGGGSYAAAAGADGWGAVQLNQQIEKAQGMPRIRARIGRIKGLLIDREVDVD